MKKRQVSIYLNQRLADEIEKLSEVHGFYFSQMIEQLLQSSVNQIAKQKKSQPFPTQQYLGDFDRNRIDIRLLEVGVEACLLNRKLLENSCSNKEIYHRMIEKIKQDAIQFVQQLHHTLI